MVFTKFIPGKYQFIWNSHTGDIRIYDVFSDGRVREKIAKTGQQAFVDKDYALIKLDSIIEFWAKMAKNHAGIQQYAKVYSTRAEIHRQIRNFIEEKN